MKRELSLFVLFLAAILCFTGCGGSGADVQEKPPAGSAPDAAEPAVVADEPVNAPTPDAPGEPDASDLPAAQGGFMFEAYGQEIFIGMEAAPLLDTLPEPDDVFEQPSCAFDGMDITYFYPGFELTTYPDGGKEHVLSIVFADDSIATPEGVFLGSPSRVVQSAYGSGYAEDGNRFVYTNGHENLIFIIEDGVVMGVIYTLITE